MHTLQFVRTNTTATQVSSKQLLDNGDNEICTKKLSLHWFPPILPVARFYDPSGGFYTARSSPRAILLAHRNLVVARELPEGGHMVHFICGSPAHPLNFIASFPPPQTSSSIKVASYLWIFLAFLTVLVYKTFPKAQRDRGLSSFTKVTKNKIQLQNLAQTRFQTLDKTSTLKSWQKIGIKILTKLHLQYQMFRLRISTKPMH